MYSARVCARYLFSGPQAEYVRIELLRLGAEEGVRGLRGVVLGQELPHRGAQGARVADLVVHAPALVHGEGPQVRRQQRPEACGEEALRGVQGFSGAVGGD